MAGWRLQGLRFNWRTGALLSCVLGVASSYQFGVASQPLKIIYGFGVGIAAASTILFCVVGLMEPESIGPRELGEKTLEEYPDLALAQKSDTPLSSGAAAQIDKLRFALEEQIQKNAELNKQIHGSVQPDIATREIRLRILRQSENASFIHARATSQTARFQWLGILSVCLGLFIVGAASFEVIFRGLDPEKVKVIAPVAGLVFNGVGGGLLLFYRTTMQTVRYYYDSKQDLDNMLTALDLMTNRMMKDKTIEMMPELIRKLYAHVGSRSSGPGEDPKPPAKPVRTRAKKATATAAE